MITTPKRKLRIIDYVLAIMTALLICVLLNFGTGMILVGPVQILHYIFYK